MKEIILKKKIFNDWKNVNIIKLCLDIVHVCSVYIYRHGV